jgi:hypothetical protein
MGANLLYRERQGSICVTKHTRLSTLPQLSILDNDKMRANLKGFNYILYILSILSLLSYILLHIYQQGRSSPSLRPHYPLLPRWNNDNDNNGVFPRILQMNLGWFEGIPLLSNFYQG